MEDENLEQTGNELNSGGGLTPSEFSAKIKEKYPQYADRDDLELAKAMVAKFPEYEGKVNFGSTEPKTKSTPTSKGENAEVSGESESPLASTGTSLSDSPSTFKLDADNILANIYPEGKDYGHMQSYVDGLRTNAAKRRVHNDPERGKALAELKATGNMRDFHEVEGQLTEFEKMNSQNNPNGKTAEEQLQNYKDYGMEVIAESTPQSVWKEKYKNLSERKDFKYKDALGAVGGTKEVDGEIVDASSATVDGIYGDFSKYGIDKEDFNTYIESGNEHIKKLYRAGYFTTDTTDLALSADNEKQVRETAKNAALAGYVSERISHLRGKHLGLVKVGNIEEAKLVEEEIKKTSKGYEDYVSENLPHYKAKVDKKLLDEYNEYKSAKDIGWIKSTGNTIAEMVDQAGEGVVGASGDATAYLLDLVGADDTAEYQRMINQRNVEFGHNSLTYGVFSGNKVNYKGTNYLVSDDGRVVDLDAGKNITSIMHKLDINKEELVRLAKDGEAETSYSTTGLLKNGSKVMGNLAFQIAATRGTSGTLGITSRGGMLANSMAVQSGMVASSTYEETLAALRRANVDDEVAKGEALDLSLKMGAVTAVTSILSPNSSAIGMTNRTVDRALTQKLAAAYAANGKTGFKTALWDYTKDKGLNMGREGLFESLQELTELVSQKHFNSKINENLGDEVLNTEITKDELIETFILSMGAGGLMAGRGKTVGDFRSRAEMLQYMSQDIEKANTILDNYVEDGGLSQDSANKIKGDLLTFARYSNKIPTDTKLEQVEPLLGMLEERGKLEQRKKNEDKAFHKSINEKIAAVDAQIELLGEKAGDSNTSKKIADQEAEFTEEELTPTLKTDTNVDNSYKLEGNKIVSKKGNSYSISIMDAQYGEVVNFEDRKRKDRFSLSVKSDSGKRVADMGVWLTGEGKWVTNVITVDEDHKREGIATAMYEFANNNGVEITPSSEQTEVGAKFSESVQKEVYNNENKKAVKLVEDYDSYNKNRSNSNSNSNSDNDYSITEDIEGSTTPEANISEEFYSDKDYTIRETLAAARSYYTESDKKVATKKLKATIDSMVKQGNLTQAQARNLMKAAAATDPQNDKQVQSFIEALTKQMNVSKKRDARNALRKLKSKIKKRGRAKSKSSPQSVKEIAAAAGRINEKYLTESEVKTYSKLLGDIEEAMNPVTSDKYKAIELTTSRRELEVLYKRSEERRIVAYMDEVGGIIDAAEIDIWGTSEDFDNIVGQMQSEKRTRLREKLINIATSRQNKLRAVREDFSDKMTLSEKNTLKLFKNTTMDALTSNQVKEFIKVADNILVNQDFSNSEVLVQAISANNDVRNIISYNKKHGINPRELNTGREALRIFGLKVPSSLNIGDHVKHLINAMTSLNVTLNIIGGNSRAGAYLYNKLGFFELSNRKTNSQIRKDKFDKVYNDLINKLAKNNEKLTDGEQVVRRAVLAVLLQSDQNDVNSMKHFKKNYIEATIKTLQEFKENHQQSDEKVEILQNMLSELEGIDTKEDLIDYLKSKDKDNYRILKFASDYFLRHSKEFQNNANVVHGESFEVRTEDDFYLPLMRSSLVDRSMVDKINDARGAMNFMSFRPSDSKSGSIFSRKKNARLGNKQTINFNFDSAIVQKYGEQIYDIESSAAILRIKHILSSQAFIDEFGLGTAQELQKKAIDKISMDSGAVFTSQFEWEKNFGKIEQILRKLGSMNALGGVDQYLKQYPAVVFSAGLRLGTDAGLLGKYMFTKKGDIGLLKISSIRLRAESDAGIKRATDMKYSDLSIGEKTKVQVMAKLLTRYGGLTLDKARELSMLSLRTGDVNAANTTFLSYYHSFLRGKGIADSDIDMDTEHVKIQEGDQARIDAQAYAQHMINTTQTSSDLTEGSQFVASPNVMARFFMGVIMPFSSHANNAMIRMLKSASNLAKGRSIAANSNEIAASLSEIVMFHSMKGFLIAPVAIYLGSLLFGADDAEEETVDWGFQTVKTMSGVLGDISPLPDAFDIDAANYVIYLKNRDKFGEDLSFKDYNKLVKKISSGKSKSFDEEDLPTQFYRYGDNDGFDFVGMDDLGLYKIPIEQAEKAREAVDLFLDGKMERENKYGQKEKYEISDENKNFLMMYTLTELLATIAVSDATTRRMMEREWRKRLKESKVKKEKK